LNQEITFLLKYEALEWLEIPKLLGDRKRCATTSMVRA